MLIRWDMANQRPLKEYLNCVLSDIVNISCMTFTNVKVEGVDEEIMSHKSVMDYMMELRRGADGRIVADLCVGDNSMYSCHLLSKVVPEYFKDLGIDLEVHLYKLNCNISNTVMWYSMLDEYVEMR